MVGYTFPMVGIMNSYVIDTSIGGVQPKVSEVHHLG